MNGLSPSSRPSRVALALAFLATLIFSCNNDKSITAPPPTGVSHPTPAILFPVKGACILAGDPIIFKGTVVKPTGKETLSWTFEGGLPSIVNDTITPTTIFPQPGSFLVRFSIEEPGLKTYTASIQIYVKSNCDTMKAIITVPASPPTINQGDAVAFTGVCTGGEPPVSGRWNFGDPAIPGLTGLTPTVVFPNPGDFSVVFTCTDSLGDAAHDTLVVHVQPAVTYTPGLFNIPVTDPDGIGSLRIPIGGWGPLPSSTTPLALGIAGSNGVALFDPLQPTKPIPGPFWNGNPTLGVQPLRYSPPPGLGPKSAARANTGVEGDALFQYGSGARLTFWDPVASSWGAFSLTMLTSSLVVDGVPYGGDESSGGLLAVAATRILEVEYDTTLPAWSFGQDFLNSDVAFLSMASAFARDRNGSMLIATDGSPGQLYLHNRTPGTPARLIGALGNTPRRLRCSGNVCVVSNFASNDLTIATWDALTDSVTITATVPVGAGPIGIDLLDLPGGDVAIVSTGFSDNTFSVTVVTQQGQLVSNATMSVDAGCGSPGHAVWLRDSGNDVLITCNATGNMQIVKSGL